MIGNEVQDDNQAIQHLNAAWDADHQQCVEAWHARQEKLDREAERARLEQQQLKEEDRRLCEKEAEREHREAEKKPHISDFDESQPPPNVIAPRLLRFFFLSYIPGNLYYIDIS